MNATPKKTVANLPPRIRAVVMQVCKKHEASPIGLMERSKRPPFVQVRADVIVQLRDMGLSYPQIGSYLNLHHSACIYYYRKYGPVLSVPIPAIPVPDFSGEWAI